MTRYETTYILDPGLDDAKIQEEIDKLSVWIREAGGEVIEVQRWGKRRLAYEINKRRDGIYTLVLWEGPGSIVREVARRMQLNEQVMRVLTVLHIPIELTRPQVAEGEAVGAGASDDNEE